MTTPAHRSPSESIVKSQPVIVHAVAAWLVSALLFAAIHFHIVVPGLTPAVTAYLVPVVTAAVGAGFTFSLWHFVAPAWKLAQAELKLAGVSVPDFGPAPASVPLSPAVTVSTPASFPALAAGDRVSITLPTGDTRVATVSATPTTEDGTITVPLLPAPVDYVAQAAALASA